jgi:hypothetical protein
MYPLGLTAVQFDRAFAEFQLFGPRKRIPIAQRLREILPEFSPEMIAQFLDECKAIESWAYDAAEQFLRAGLAEDAAEAQIAQKYPFLTAKQVRRTLNQALFYAMK